MYTIELWCKFMWLHTFDNLHIISYMYEWIHFPCGNGSRLWWISISSYSQGVTLSLSFIRVGGWCSIQETISSVDRPFSATKKQTFSPASYNWDMWHTDIPSTHNGRRMCQLVAISWTGRGGLVGSWSGWGRVWVVSPGWRWVGVEYSGTDSRPQECLSLKHRV